MTYRGYAARKDFDNEDEIIGGRVIDIDDIISFHSSSVAWFEAAFNAPVDSYLRACQQRGQAANKPASGRMMLRVNPAVHAAAVKASVRSAQSLNKWAEKVLERAAHAEGSIRAIWTLRLNAQTNCWFDCEMSVQKCDCKT